MTISLDIHGLTAAYARGTLTPADVIEEIYRRIAAEGERPIWITLVSKSEAQAKAASAPRGPLYGIPFAVKDNIDVAGLPTTCACPDFAYAADETAHAVALLEAAGAILIGKTNLDQFATGLNGTRSPYGIPASAFNSEYISGGSSSGSAVAVAKGLVSFALGTDTAGSGRVPAAFNNLVGLKPTKGLISTHGVVPACRTQDTVSIFASTVAEAASVFSVLSGFDEKDPYARTMRGETAPRVVPAALRIGIPREPLEFFSNADSVALYRDATQRAAALGATLVEIDFTPFAEAARLLYAGPWVAERLAAIKYFALHNAQSMHATVRDIILGARSLTAVAAFDGLYDLAQLTRQAEAEWAKMDVLMLPTAPTAYRIADMLADPVRLNSNLGLYTNFVNLMDLSALAVPAGFGADGLPFGVTLIARALEDGLLAAFGDKMHRALPGATLGATDVPLAATPPVEVKPRKTVEVAVVGAHLSGQPLNSQLIERSARLVRTARTAPGYSFYALANTVPPKPGLVYDGKGAGLIEVEIWEMDEAAFGSFVALIPSPLGIGTLSLSDGTAVKGFLCEAHAVHGAENITASGGWRAWIAATAPK
jgi:allophanate hydrolase